jgi:cytochrome c-type biogenesis protein CcmF
MMVQGQGEQFTSAPGLYMSQNLGQEKPSPVLWPAIQRHPLYDLIVIAYPPAFEATGSTSFKRDETKAHSGMTLTYKGYESNGKVGMGAKFIAHFVVTDGAGKETNIAPDLEVGSNGPIYTNAKIDDTFELRLDAISANDGSAMASIYYQEAGFPVQVFYKPLTVFVFWGVGIMTLGCLWAAWGRKAPRGSTEASPTVVEQESDALTPTA